MSTVIAYINKEEGIPTIGYMASDNTGIDDDNSVEFNNSKIFKYTGNKYKELNAEGYNILIGMAGDYKELELLRYYDELFDDFVSLNHVNQNNHINRRYIVKNIIPRLQKLFNNQTKCNSDIIMIASNKIYVIQSNYSVLEPTENYYAIGVGRCYAFGALYLATKLNKEGKIINTNIEHILQTIIESSKYYPGIGGKIDILSQYN